MVEQMPGDLADVRRGACVKPTKCQNHDAKRTQNATTKEIVLT